jgi:hydroxymethylbilane synthase
VLKVKVMSLYPIVLALRDRRTVVVGGGAVAERKVHGLREAQAEVVVIAPELTPALRDLAAAGELTWQARAFAPGDAAGALLVFAATDDPAVNAAVVADARAHGALVNDAGEAERGDFRTPAVHRSGPLTVSVDSAGLAPSFTARVRDELALQFDARYARAAATLGAVRARVTAVVPPERRGAVLKHFAERDVDDLAGMPAGAIEHEVERTADTVAGVVPAAPTTLVAATRGSALALWQTRSVMAKLAERGIASTLLTVTTRTDAQAERPLRTFGGDAFFVRELEVALRDGRAHYAVHSCKDLPSGLADDMTVAAILAREDPRDAFCSERYASFESLPPGARVGTSSPRRRAQLAALRPDLRFEDIRGNVDTRLRKLRDGDYDAIVLALAGLRRLGLSAAHTVPFAVETIVPAVGQGALAIETRAEGELAPRLAALLADPPTELAVRAERAFLRTLRGGCQAPVGAHGVHADGTLRLIAAIAAPDGTTVLRDARIERLERVADAEGIGTELAHQLLARGGDTLLAAGRTPEHPAGALAGQLMILPRTTGRTSRIAAALREAGAEVVEAHDGAAAAAALEDRTPTAILLPSSGAVRAIADYLAVLRAARARPIVAAMGAASAQAAGACGWPADVVADRADVGAFVQTVTRYILEQPQ